MLTVSIAISNLVCKGVCYGNNSHPYGTSQGLRVSWWYLRLSALCCAVVRLSALQGLPVLMSHDSIAKLVKMTDSRARPEHLTGLRVIPNLTVLRPADARETQAAWYLAPESIHLTARSLTCQNLWQSKKAHRLWQGSKEFICGLRNRSRFDTILLASGSEVNLRCSC